MKKRRSCKNHIPVTNALPAYCVVLICGIKEDEGNAWEKREATVQKFKTFLNKGLNINPDDVKLVDIHRLPQYPKKKNGKTMHSRPYQILVIFFNFLGTLPKVVVQLPIQFTTVSF